MGQLFETVLADRFEQPIARLGWLRVEHDKRLFNQLSEKVQHIITEQKLVAAHDLGRFERPAPGKHRQPPQQGALRLGQQAMAPVDERAQRLMPLQGGAAAVRQQREAVVQAFGHLFHPHGPDPRCGQL